MPVINYNAVMDVDADSVWAVLKQFGQISKWHPAIHKWVIEEGQPDGLVGSVRRLTSLPRSQAHCPSSQCSSSERASRSATTITRTRSLQRRRTDPSEAHRHDQHE